MLINIQMMRGHFLLCRERYRSGLTDFLTVLDAEQQLYNSEDLLAKSQIALITNLITLYKALAVPGRGRSRCSGPTQRT